MKRQALTVGRATYHAFEEYDNRGKLSEEDIKIVCYIHHGRVCVKAICSSWAARQ